MPKSRIDDGSVVSFLAATAVTAACRPENVFQFEEWADHQLTEDVIADLTKIEQRILAGNLAFDFQNDISNAETKLFELENVKASILLSKLSLIHMVEIGIANAKDPKIARLLQTNPATRTQDFAPLLARLIAEVRSGNPG